MTNFLSQNKRVILREKFFDWGGTYYIHEGHSINKGNFFDWGVKFKKKKQNNFFRIFSLNTNSALFGIGL